MPETPPEQQQLCNHILLQNRKCHPSTPGDKGCLRLAQEDKDRAAQTKKTSKERFPKHVKDDSSASSLGAFSAFSPTLIVLTSKLEERNQRML